MDSILKLWSKIGTALLPLPVSATATTQTSAELVPHPEMLTDGVYELHRPVKPKVEILFFHGFQSGDDRKAYMRTWMSASNRECWPGTWLVERIPDARILLVSYDSSPVRSATHGRLDLFATGESLLVNIADLALVGQDHDCPVVLIGHSLGGLVIKELCIQAHRISTHVTGMSGNSLFTERRRKFLHMLQGMFFFSTPHTGSMLATLATGLLSGPLLKDLTLLNSETARLNQEFSRCRAMYNWRLGGVGEAYATSLGTCQVVIVSEASARHEMDSFMMVPADHINICKPRDQTSSAFQFLTTFILDILKREASYLRKQRQLCGLPEHAVGLHKSAQAVQRKLEQAHQLGIVGMGGIGKTTLAKAVFNNICASFEYTCFIEDVKEHWKQPFSRLKLQELVHTNLYHFGRKVTDMLMDEQMWKIINGKTFLLVLDGINSRDQITRLPGLENFGKTSRMIVTTHNKGLLEGFVHHDVEVLGDLDSEKMFCSHAFEKKDVLPAAFKDIGMKILQKCSGLPLTIEVMGKFLKQERDMEIWRQALLKLERAEDLDGSVHGSENFVLWAKLRISVTNLGEEEKEMFLDIATHLFGLPLYLIKATANSDTPDICFNNLVNRSLVQVRESQWNFPWEFIPLSIPVVGMHEQLRDLGRSLARHGRDAQNHNRLEFYSRMWEENKAEVLLRSNQGISETNVLELKAMSFAKGEKIPTNSLARFKQLRYLALHNIPFQGSFDEHFPSQLAFLQWSDRKQSHLPIKAMQLTNLRVLALVSCDALKALPEPFELLTKLRVLTLMCPLRQLPERLGNLSLLQRLQLHSDSITLLPNSFGELLSLQHLVLFCSELQRLPETFGQLSRLQAFTLQSSKLRALPESFGRLHALEILCIECRQVESLPNSFGLLKSLQSLRLKGCQVMTLPETFADLSSLQSLQVDIANEGQMLMLPENFGHLPSLAEMDLGFVAMGNVPNSFRQLLQLKKLTFMIDGMPPTVLWKLGSNLRHMPSMEQLNYHYIDKLLSWEMWGSSKGSNDNKSFTRGHILYNLLSTFFDNGSRSSRDVESERLQNLKLEFEFAAWEHEVRTGFIDKLDEIGWDCSSLDNRTVLRNLGKVKIHGKKATIWRHFGFGGLKEEGLKWKYMKNYHARENDAALQTLDKLVKDHKGNQFYWQERGVLKGARLDDLEGAAVDLETALQLMPDKYECLKHRAYVRHLMGDEARSKADAERAMTVMPDHVREQWLSPYKTTSLGALPVQFSIYNLP